MVIGNLPWRRIRDKPTIGKLKETHTFQNTEELLRGLPPQFSTMLNYLKKLSFESEPDYEYLKNICKSYFSPHKDSFDSRTYDECQFEWVTISNDLNHDSHDLSQEFIITTNPDRTDSRSRTTKLSTSVFFGSTHLSANSNLGNQAALSNGGSGGEFSKSLPDMYKKKGNHEEDMNEEAAAPGKKRQKKKKKNGNDDDNNHDNSKHQLGLRPEKQPHCKCTIM